MKDIIIIGGGPAALTAALYAGRAGLNALMLEKQYEGGQIVTTNEVENYPGFRSITGSELANTMYEHAKDFGSIMKYEEVIDIKVDGDIKKVITGVNTYESKVIILSMGAKPKKLGIDREEELTGKGVSYCATCDGGFFRKKVVAVVGGGDTAVEDALHLSRIAEKVYVIVRRDSLRANKSAQKKLFEANNVEIIWNSGVTKLNGEEKLSGIEIKNNKDGKIDNLEVNGVFVAIGSDPSSELVKDLVALDKNGYIIADESCKTNVDGIFAIGDIRTKEVRQVLTAAADGAVSIYGAEKYLINH
ncbi:MULTISPECIES: thioredoxin-disulfide reductase [Clostridium]|uniref:Thioredoxin reductase n=1 Tax=Clostridium beijerinckii TaxID=1520 RepID=A0A1S9N784_CLOBE|nr:MULTISPECIES: thioredoxin-disulfide reductase [Clostridium]MBN7575059.1 thioredoxin-disulfide reductase [Clostridium beijerinckii]MBN7577828.1 thioredoxin-disulfide reductase [Clostridium beijerinckii]MBN7584822.1 thioredoxin-disulfide reductase [Clostridium beijerinckii]MBO0518811.1 thioredoxin-disulfide reductase [Clostridium beijerinckii]OOP73305.1 thioredoxin-disulfide reductase [Clostridium beijerinckii]